MRRERMVAAVRECAQGLGACHPHHVCHSSHDDRDAQFATHKFYPTRVFLPPPSTTIFSVVTYAPITGLEAP